MSVLQNRKAAAGLSVLVDFIAHLDEHKGVIEELRAAQVAADEAVEKAAAREAEIAKAHTHLADREKNASAVEEAARARQASTDAGWKQLASAKQGFAEFQKDAEAELDERDDLLRAREQELDERDKWIKHAASELGGREKELDDREAGLKRLEADLERREADYQDRLARLKSITG